MRKPVEERRFDRLALVRRERSQCRAQRLALLAQLEHVAWIGNHLGQQLHIAAVAALLSALEAQAVDRPRARLVHDPAEHRAVRGVVPRRAPPHVVEDVDGELFSGFAVGRDSHDQSEDGAMSPLVERMQRELVARSDRLDERRPVLLRHRSLGPGIQHVAQCCRRPLCTFLAHDRHHWPTFLQKSASRSRSAMQDRRLSTRSDRAKCRATLDPCQRIPHITPAALSRRLRCVAVTSRRRSRDG